MEKSWKLMGEGHNYESEGRAGEEDDFSRRIVSDGRRDGQSTRLVSG